MGVGGGVENVVAAELEGAGASIEACACACVSDRADCVEVGRLVCVCCPICAIGCGVGSFDSDGVGGGRMGAGGEESLGAVGAGIETAEEIE